MRTLLLAFALTTLCTPAEATLTISYEGTLDFVSGADVLGLDSAAFTWVGTFDENATRSFTNGSNLDRFSGDISLTLSGTFGGFYDGTYSPAQNTVGELTVPGFVDYLDLSNAASFIFGPATLLDVGAVMLPEGFTGAISSTNRLTPVNSTDVVDFGMWHVSYGGEPIFYNVTNAEISSSVVEIPEPSSQALFALSTLGLLALRRPKYLDRN